MIGVQILDMIVWMAQSHLIPNVEKNILPKVGDLNSFESIGFANVFPSDELLQMG